MNIKTGIVLGILLIGAIASGCLLIEPNDAGVKTNEKNNINSESINSAQESSLKSENPGSKQPDSSGFGGFNQIIENIKISVGLKKSPDLMIKNIEAPVKAVYAFNVKINISEIGKKSAGFNISIKEGNKILALIPGTIEAEGNTQIDILIFIKEVGIHNLTAVIQDASPAETKTNNNQKNFSIEIIKPDLQTTPYTTTYYFQKDEYFNTKNINLAANGGTHIEVSTFSENKTIEKLYYNMIINNELVFPIDYLNIQIQTESGNKEIFEKAFVDQTITENGINIAFITYPEYGTKITLRVGNGYTEMIIEKRTQIRDVFSSGYNYYSDSDNSSWNTNSSEHEQNMLNPLVYTSVNIELVDNGIGYDGNMVMNLNPPVISNQQWNQAGYTGFRNVTTYYISQSGKTQIS